MKVWGKYNILLLRDGGAFTSFRISHQLARVVMLSAVILPLLGLVGLWFGWQAWSDRQDWEQEERVLQQEMASLRAQIERLAHVDRLIQLSESGQMPEAGRNPASDQAPGTAANSQGAAQPLSTSEASRPATPEENFDPDKLAVNVGRVRVDGVAASLSKDRRLRVRMDLYNDSDRQIAGALTFFLLTADEKRVPLPFSDSVFRISRLKRFTPIFVVPDSAGNLVNATLGVEVVNSDNVLLFRQFYPITE